MNSNDTLERFLALIDECDFSNAFILLEQVSGQLPGLNEELKAEIFQKLDREESPDARKILFKLGLLKGRMHELKINFEVEEKEPEEGKDLLKVLMEKGDPGTGDIIFEIFDEDDDFQPPEQIASLAEDEESTSSFKIEFLEDE
ncbi:hypothetical protein ACFL35_19430, partial [Candidatus Riflebacteria bacterium]